MTVSTTRCCRRLLEALLVLLALACAAPVLAGSIEPVNARLSAGDDGYVLTSEFAIDLGVRLEEAVSRGVPLYFNLEFTLDRDRWYWLNEHVAGVTINYRLAYNALTRQYRLSSGGLHQSFATLTEALRVMARTASLPVADKGILKPGETYAAALRLSLDRNQLPKPFQVDAIANRDWQVDARTLRWQFVYSEAPAAPVPAVPAPIAGKGETR
jgi:hypothetical protein